MVSAVVILVVSSVLTELLTEKIEDERAALMRETALFLLDSGNFNIFAEKMDSLFSEIFSSVPTPVSASFREQLWCKLHHKRLTEILKLWSALYESSKAPEKYSKEPLLMQYCTTKLFEIAVKSNYPSTKNTAETTSDLTSEEENTLLY
uniref:Uncharacterized protein n=1 Tax=Amphimedon queenslandica TaxID=400682 RepID=A0A1X7VYF3_AMPQE